MTCTLRWPLPPSLEVGRVERNPTTSPHEQRAPPGTLAPHWQCRGTGVERFFHSEGMKLCIHASFFRLAVVGLVACRMPRNTKYASRTLCGIACLLHQVASCCSRLVRPSCIGYVRPQLVLSCHAPPSRAGISHHVARHGAGTHTITAYGWAHVPGPRGTSKVSNSHRRRFLTWRWHWCLGLLRVRGGISGYRLPGAHPRWTCLALSRSCPSRRRNAVRMIVAVILDRDIGWLLSFVIATAGICHHG
ncbi:hypothetical protein J3F83DRAFT_446311 [Trichoderma novae-zelandiae]